MGRKGGKKRKRAVSKNATVSSTKDTSPIFIEQKPNLPVARLLDKGEAFSISVVDKKNSPGAGKKKKRRNDH